jgi:nicotinate dehydrogenase subunit A
MAEFDILVNGTERRVSAAGSTPLLDVLRNHLDLRGTRYGCGQEKCGACLVLLDGEPSYSCTLPVDAVGGRTVTTVEGVAADKKLFSLRQAFLDEQAGQCGYCLSGIVVAAAALLRRNPDPSHAEIAAALDGNLCRCGAHNRILRAVARAAAAMRAET